MSVSKVQKGEVRHRYTDTPDGQDVFPKLWFALKSTAPWIFGAATTDVMLYSHPKGYAKTLGRYAFIGLPLFGIVTTFVVTSNIACSIRKKDDIYNWMMAGAASGSIFGLWTRRPFIGWNMALFCAFAATNAKYCWDQKWYAVPDYAPTASGGVWSVNQDWSLTKDRPGNWTTKAQ